MEKVFDSTPVSGISYCVMDYDLTNYNTKYIVPLEERVKALEGVRGLDGRGIELKKGLFPEDPNTPDNEDTRAILWRPIARPNESEFPWTLLVFEKELQGERGVDGEKGEKGDAGANMTLRGAVNSTSELLTQTNAEVGWAFLLIPTGELYVFIGSAGQYADLSKWKNFGSFTGMKGNTGPQGPRGPAGPKGSSGGISGFLLNWIVSTATNQALTAVQLEVNTAINDAINDMAMQLTNLAEDAAQSALEKALDDMMDEFKGEKGDKGDKGDDGNDGKDGAACTILGHKATEFELFPITGKAGDAWLVGDENNLYIWAANEVGGVDLGTWKNVGKVQGPEGKPGKDADWVIQLRDEDNVATDLVKIEDVAEGVPNMYIQGKDGVLVEAFMGTSTGFTIKNKYPIPSINTGSGPFPSTQGKVLSNDGTKLVWVEDKAQQETVEVIRLQSPNGTVFLVTVTDDGRLNVMEEKL
ncbi:MAG: hypothetical protein ACRCR2_02425 [Fusobacteriaceae bacterium]